MRLPARLVAAIVTAWLVAWSCLAGAPAMAQSAPVAAQAGANSDLTSISGLTTPLPPTEGGTGQTSLSGLCAAIGCLPTAGGSLTGALSLGSGSLTGPAGALLASATAPTIKSGFGTAPSISGSNGTASFTITVGSPSASSGVLTLPPAANGWNCDFVDRTTHSATVSSTVETASTPTSVTLANYTDLQATGGSWTAGDVIQAKCLAY